MRIDILTLFPQMFDAPLGDSIIGRAQSRGLLDIRCHQIRDFTENRQNQVDDYPYGGGNGCVMQAQPLYSAWQAVSEDGGPAHTIYFSPRGRVFTQSDAVGLVKSYDRLILVCGHYEGVDQRFIDMAVDEEISLGDFVLTGGEIPAMALADAVCRMVPGVLSNESCFTEESHFNGLLEYPQYSRPEVWEGRQVPAVLTSGNHGAVRLWRRKMSLITTLKNRPDMFKKLLFTKEDHKLLAQLQAETADPRVRDILAGIHTGRITVRPTSQRDLTGLTKLFKEQGQNSPDPEQWLSQLQSQENYIHFSIYGDGLGFCGCAAYRRAADTAQLELYLMPHARGRGIGAFALAHVIDHAVHGGARLCTLPLTPKPPQGLISRIGLIPSDSAYILDSEAWLNRR